MWDVPGEKLVIKMWESLVDNGIGGLLRPWQTGRDGRAQIRNRALEVVAIAQAERDAQEILAGRVTLAEPGLQARLTSTAHIGNASDLPALDSPKPLALEYSVKSATVDAVRKEANVANAIVLAEAELADKTDAVPAESVDTDWLYRWRDAAGTVSSEELQQLWAKILAGEIVKPGSFSLRTMDVLRNFSKAHAELTSRAFRFVYDGTAIAKIRSLTDFLAKEGLSFGDLLDLEAIGVIAGVQGQVLNSFSSKVEGSFLVGVQYGRSRAIIVRAENPERRLRLESYVLTPVGRELFKLGNFGVSEEYLRLVAESVKGDGFNVSVANCVVDGDEVSWTDEIPV